MDAKYLEEIKARCEKMDSQQGDALGSAKWELTLPTKGKEHNAEAMQYAASLLREIASGKYAPTVDAIPVVRCKNCIDYDPELGCMNYEHPMYSDDFYNHMNADDFCSYGIRKGMILHETD